MANETAQPVWTPDTIMNIVYRVVMMIISITFIWIKCRRPSRKLDDEQLVGIIAPLIAYPPQANPTTQRHHHPFHTILREFIESQIESIVESCLGGDDNGGTSLSIQFQQEERPPTSSTSASASSCQGMSWVSGHHHNVDPVKMRSRPNHRCGINSDTNGKFGQDMELDASQSQEAGPDSKDVQAHFTEERRKAAQASS